MGKDSLNNKPVPPTQKYKFECALSIDTISDVYSDSMVNASLFTPTFKSSLPHYEQRIILLPRGVLKNNLIEHHKWVDGGNTHGPSGISTGVRFETLTTEPDKISKGSLRNPPETFNGSPHSGKERCISIDNALSQSHHQDRPTIEHQCIYPPERYPLNEIRENIFQEDSYGENSIISDSQRNIWEAEDISWDREPFERIRNKHSAR